jgi:hypothetical protein
MAQQRLTRLRHQPGAALLATLALAGLVLAAATVPHTHVTATPGLFNQEHDLTYLATLSGVGPLTQAAGAVALIVVVAAVLAPSLPTAASGPGRHPDSRAPPLR